ncbi:MAG TPA: hypothetical protein VMR66_09985 [Gemmatimonadota bacterium]|nr:hypothetical protein [Gemmatimonadota bacterium]
MRRSIALALILALAAACGRDEPAEDEIAPGDTVGMALEPGGAASGGAEETPTTTDAPATTASSPEATGAPSPPEGYAIESRPAQGGALAVIEYVSPRTTAEVSEFYDRQMQSARRVVIDVAGDDIVVYGLGANTTIGPATRIQDVERLLDQRTESMVVVAPHRMQSSDPLIRDLRDAGQQAQADALGQTRSKITVVYAVQ